MLYTYSTEQLPCSTREKQYVQLEIKDAQAMNKFINKLQDLNIADKLIGYEPAGLTVHPPPPRMIEGGFIFFVWVSSVTKIFSSKKSGFCRRYLH